MRDLPILATESGEGAPLRHPAPLGQPEQLEGSAPSAPGTNSSLVDQFGRRIEYLRISVTDRCNFRCVYCMPLEGLPWLPKEDILSYEEIAEVVRQLAPLGLKKIRLTGGEPTIRPELHKLIRMLRDIPQVEDISLSTNGARLPEIAGLYRDNGLDRVNMSCDSLRPERIAAIARRNLKFDPILSLKAAQAAGLDPIKVNVVVLRGINDDEIPDFARLTFDNPWHVRFIELMPVGDMRELTWEHVVPSEEVLSRVATLGRIADDSGPRRGNGPAKYYRLAGAKGTLGAITPMSHTYCGSCNRVRLTANGELRACLYDESSVTLRDALRSGAPLEDRFRRVLAIKPREHRLLSGLNGQLAALSMVGG